MAQKNNDEIFAKVSTVIANQLNIAQNSINEQATLESLGADSLDRVEIVMKLEEEFDIEINDEDAEKLTTLGQTVDYIKKLKQK